MIIRPPSNQNPRDDFWSRDPALVQLAPDATEAQKLEYANKLRVARETANWSALLIEGRDPTKFTFKPLAGHLFRKFSDLLRFNKIGRAELAQLVFRACVVGISNAGDIKLERKHDPEFGDMATVEFANDLDGVDLNIIGELGGECFDRAIGVSPKS